MSLARRSKSITALFLFFLATAHGETFTAAIQAEGTGGDVVQIRREGATVAVRLYGVAAPLPGQPDADLANTFLLETAMDTRVIVELTGKDNLGVPVAWVKLPEGATLNEELVRRGLAWWDEPNAPEAKGLQQAAAEALAAKRGLWAGAAPVAPWDYRRSAGQPEVTYGKQKETDKPAMSGSTTVRPPAATTTAPATAPKSAPPAEEDYFPTDPAEHLALMLKHQPRIALDKAGNPVGLTATDIATVPGARRVGLQDGDVVQSVNGIKLVDEAQVLGLVTQLQDAKQLDLKVLRGGKVVDLTVALEY